MELRGQDKRIAAGGGGGGVGIPSNFTYGFTSIISATGGVGERRSNNNNNNTAAAGNGTVRSTLNPSQTLDQFHHHHQHLLPQLNHNRPSSSSSPQPQSQPQSSRETLIRDEDSDPDPPHPDPVPVPVDASTTTTTPTPTIRYKECLKNHAASIGGHVIDGCGEFMPSSEEGTPGALKCAACDCHRSFHRKEIEGESSQSVTNCYFCYNRNNKTDTKTRALPPPPPQGPQQPPLPPPPQPATIQHHQKFSSKLPNSHQAGQNQPMMMAFGSGGGTDQSSSEEFNVYQSNVGPGHHQHPSLQPGQPYTMSSSSSKKRFRTKFSQEQKEKMAEFAEKIGWRISKQDEAAVQQFCVEVGVKRQVLKVWMHNNKHISTKKKLEEEL